ncbi:MAG: cell division protein FtsQ/DivIB [Pseudomonadota bacterium]
MAKEKASRGATPKKPKVPLGTRLRVGLREWRARHRTALNACAGLVVLSGVATGGWYLQQGMQQVFERFPIQQVSVMGELHHVDRAALSAALQPYMEDNFFAIELEKVKETMESFTWIDHAEVRKEWPHTLKVELIERVPVANWGKKQFLSAKGEIFFAENVQPNPNLPTFIGMAEQAPLIAEHYVQMQSVLRNAGLSIQTLEMTDRVSSTLLLRNGLSLVVDEKNSLDKLKRFTELYQLFSEEQRQQLLRVDLRYENGLAIKWKKGDGDTNAA